MKGVLDTCAHGLLKAVVWPGHRRFVRGLKQLRQVQLKQLREIIGQSKVGEIKQISQLDEAQLLSAFKKMPLTDYSHYQQALDLGQPLTESPTVRMQPTSGSTSSFKTIPYTRKFLMELDAAIMPWFFELYRQYPGLLGGKQYWSLSWVPESRRKLLGDDLADDSKLLSFGKKWLAKRTQAVPETIGLADTVENAFFATLAYLIAEPNLRMISVWSPTFGIQLLQQIDDKAIRTEIIQTLKTGTWPAHRQLGLKQVRAPSHINQAQILERTAGLNAALCRRLWPTMQLISCWDTALSKTWAKALHAYFPDTKLEGKGLWMTEGVVSFPFQKQNALAYQSHFYEFECVESQTIYFAWQLKKDKSYIPIITTGSGFVRYKTADQIRVTGFIDQLPIIEFIGRISGVDLVGEKISVPMANKLLHQLNNEYKEITPISLLAVNDPNQPFYLLLLEISHEQKGDARMLEQCIAKKFEEQLKQSFHYELARNLDQLGELKVVSAVNAMEYYIQGCQTMGMVAGDIKIEPLRLLSGQGADFINQQVLSRL